MAQLDQPIILFCSERSGSNLIAKIFDKHTRVSAPGASHLFRIMSECASRFEVGSNELRRTVISLFRLKASHWLLDSWTDTDIEALLRLYDFSGDMVAALYDTEAKIAGKRHVFTKENSSFKYMTMLQVQSSQPRFLFMVRDPRDMAASWNNAPVMRGGVLRATERWLHDQAGYVDTLAQLGGSALTAFLRYEDLLKDPEGEVKRICIQLKLPFENAMVDFSEASRSARADAKRFVMWANVDKPIISDNTQKFRYELTDDQIAYIEAATAPLMAALGYSTSRCDQPEYGRFDTLGALHAHLADKEPHAKLGYRDVPGVERGRLEEWSRLVEQLRGRPPRCLPAGMVTD